MLEELRFILDTVSISPYLNKHTMPIFRLEKRQATLWMPLCTRQVGGEVRTWSMTSRAFWVMPLRSQ